MLDDVIVGGYRADRLVVVVKRDGGKLVLSLIGSPAEVEKLVFFAGAAIVVVIPVLPGTLDVDQDGKSVAIQCRMRAFSLETNSQSIFLDMKVGLRADGAPEFSSFAIRGWNPIAGFKATAFAEVGNRIFTREHERAPRCAAALGLDVYPTGHPVKVELRFTRLITFKMIVELPNTPGKQQTLPTWGLSFETDELTKPNRVTPLVIRQPEPDAPDEAIGWPANHWIVELDVPWAAVARRWKTGIVEPYVRALHTVQDGRPVSLLPTLPATGQGRWRATFSLVDRRPNSDEIEKSDFVGCLPKGELVDRKVNMIPRTLRPLQPMTGVTLELGAFRTTDGERKPLTIVATIEPPTIEQGEDGESDLARHNEGIFFGIVHTSTATEQIVRVGALDLVFATKGTIDTGSVGVAKVSFRPSEKPGEPGLPRIEQLRLALGAMGIRPGNQDPIPGEEFNESSLAFAEPKYDAAFRRAVPLVIDIVDRTKIPFADTMVLTAQESAIEQESQTLSMSIASASAPLQDVDVVVIDTSPFAVSRVQIGPQIDNGAETTAIGNWSNRSADLAWEIASAASGFHLVLPPQGMGETMERRRGDFIETVGGKEAVVPADFRFSPNARLRLRSSFFKQRFVEVPWNLRRVLGYPGQRAAGAGVDRLDFELLYGLAVHVENRRLRLAELAARLGELPGRQEPVLPWRPSADQQKIYRRYRDSWKDQYPALLSRLGILEPYEVDREGTLTLTDADGVGYELRSTADLADPIPRRALSAPFQAKGLRGGWSWGFESANVLDAVLRTPRSSSALLARPFFSALGGWGFQKASFDQNRSTIYSDTAMGRSFSISIERIGRISVLWNRAKHVIVYERTVMPTRQFAGTQDLLLGIPVVRKVREYVEILQDERNYPEFGETPAGPGCICGSFFPEGTRRINVDSTWGEDVGRIGWKVPLWRRDADPVVYPRPIITVKVAGDHPEKINPLALSEPDKLYFFTNTEANQTADTDAWPAVEGIDYPRFKGCKAPDPDFGVGTPTKAEDRTKTPEVFPGTSGFTFALDATPHAADVVHGRTEEVIGAILRNVTLTRGPLLEASGTTLSVVSDLTEQATQAVIAVVNAKTFDLGEVKKAALQELGKVKAELDLLLPTSLDREAVCTNLGEALRRELERATTANGALVPIVDQVMAVGRALRSSVAASLTALRDLGQTVEAARAKLQNERIRLFAESVGAIRSMRTHVGALEESVGRARVVIKTVRQAVADELAKAIATIDTAVTWTNQLRADVKARAETLLRAIEPLERAVEESGRTLTGPVPDQVRVLVREAAQFLRRAAQRTIAVTSAAQTIAPQLLKGELAKLAGDVDGKLGVVDQQLHTLAGEIAQAFSTTPVEDALQSLDGELEKLIKEAVDWQPLLAAVEKALDGWLGDPDKLIKAQIAALTDFVVERAKIVCRMLPDPTALRDALVEMVAAIDQQIQDVLDGITPDVADVERLVNQIGNDVRSAVEEVATAAGVTLGEVASSGERVFRLVRAFGDVPRVPGLGFDLDQIAYHFVDIGKHLVLPDVSLSPVIAHASQLVDAASQALQPLGTGLPTIKLLDRVVPYQLEDFDLSSVFPDFAGLKLDGLFSNIRMPKIANDNVRITHGFDQQAMRGWVEVDADVPFDEPITVVSILGITLTLVSGRFRATSRIDAQAGQSPQQTFAGDISGEWRLHVGGFDLVAFVDTHLRFDDRGNLRFEVSPDRIKLQAVLQFVSELLASFGYSESGFSIRLLPTSVQSTLNLPLPDIQGGTFGLANLVLGSEFSLEFLPTFAITAGFFLGKKHAPFTITVFILGGAGWVDVRLRYVPRDETLNPPASSFESTVSVGITAAASLAISLGPIKGGIYAYFGITVEYSSSSTGVSDLRIGLLLMFRGEVTLLGFLSVGLCLALEAQYTSGGGLIGRGRVSYSIKICWCVTINVSTEVSYTFGSSGGKARQQLVARAAAGGQPTYESAAAEYVDMFA